MNLSVICALIACASYVLFASCYEPVVRTVSDTRHAAVILYALAGTILLFLACLVGLFSQSKWLLPNETIFFGLPISADRIVWALLAGVCAMTILYALHIETEARSREQINMGVYSVIFQLNVIVVAGLDTFLFHPTIVPSALLGSLIILAASCGGLVLHAHSIGARYKSLLRTMTVWAAVLSAVSCGVALVIDGEVVRNLVLKDTPLGDSISPFLFYEALTFLLPSLSLFVYLWFARLRDERHSPLWPDFVRAPSKFFLAALFSASQFAFSVFALAIPGPRFMPAAVLACAPFLCVLADSNRRSTAIVLGETLCAICAAIGIAIVLY